MSTRTASCCCGGLTLVATGDPDFVVACHCEDCQRRTGSAFGVGAYYPRSNIAASGAYSVYVREGQAGRRLRFHFCPACGTSLYWELELRPDHIGVAVGALRGAAVSPPSRSVWEQSRHPWVAFEHEVIRYPRQVGS